MWPHAPESRVRSVTAVGIWLLALLGAPLLAGSLSVRGTFLSLLSIGGFFAGFIGVLLVLGIQWINPLCSAISFRRMCLMDFYFFGGALVLFTTVGFFATMGLPLSLHALPRSDLAMSFASLPLFLGTALAGHFLYKCNLQKENTAVRG